MKLTKTRLLTSGLINALAVLLYTLAIAWLLDNLGQIFSPYGPQFVQITAFLMIIILSVIVIGLLIFGWPAVLYVQGSRKESLYLITVTAGFLFLLTVIAVLMNVLI